MKISKLLLSSTLLLLVSLITCQDKRAIIADNLINITTTDKPKGLEGLISEFDTKLRILYFSLTLKEIAEMQKQFKLSTALTLQIKASLYSKSGISKINEAFLKDYYFYERTVGAAIKENNEKITFGLIKVNSLPKFIKRYETIDLEECHRVWIFFKKCKIVKKKREITSLTDEEKILVTQAAKYSVGQTILKGINILKRDDYYLYMEDTFSLYSPNGQSAFHVTYYGNIAIGEPSEEEILLPINYEFLEKSNIKTEYPMLGKDVVVNDFFLNYGMTDKFSFLIKKKINNFSKIDYSKKDENNHYALEVKKNGNVILYEKNTNEIIWQTNTANQGIGPYNFHLTNDRTLILEDSTGKILYQSKKYVKAPTIYYGCEGKNGRHVYNGLILNQVNSTYYDFEGINPSKIHIMTENDEKYKITYGGSIIGIKPWFEYDNQKKYNPEFYEGETKINTFYAYLNVDEEDFNFDICYAARLNDLRWTNFACNGEDVGVLNSIPDTYIQSLVIYAKRKDEDFPFVSDSNEAVITS